MAETMILSTSNEAARYVTDLKGWVARGGQFWGEDERMARWSGATHVPCNRCGKPTQKSYVICEKCREVAAREKYAARERRPYDGGFVYSETLSRYFDDEDDLRDFIEDSDKGVTVESLRLVLCDPVFASEIDGDDFYCDDLPEDCTLDDVAGDIAEAIAKVNEVIAERRKAGKALSWMPGQFAVDARSLPSDLRREQSPSVAAVDPAEGRVTGGPRAPDLLP